ncbi:hypothetical protein OJAV_G00013750 [Oryzias javanicus]|uniref:Uncharacterized protein n=1 Tax=Oryzias javanicus TaxID=123683 RepID=A0A3S2N7B3_ORYJA|nr:hypothetical protein OJAV_G00013750 [Oryzias javanicus]
MAPRRMETKPAIVCMKTLLLIYSFVFWVTGMVLLSVGLWWKFMLGPYTLLISNGPSNAPYMLTGAGAAIVLFGLFGCFATCRGRPWMLKLYAALLTLVFIIELTAGISGFVFRHEVKETFFITFREAVIRYDGRDDKSVAVDDVQRKLRCCGVSNYTSWFSTLEDLKNATLAAGKVHKQGCFELVVSFIENNVGIIAGVTFGVAFSQVVGMCLACCLSHFISSYQYEMTPPSSPPGFAAASPEIRCSSPALMIDRREGPRGVQVFVPGQEFRRSCWMV